MRTAITLAAAAFALGSVANATVLTFDQSAPNTPTVTGAQVATSYGDRVAEAEQFGYTYEVGDEGFTPNVQVGLVDETLSAEFGVLGTALTGTSTEDLVIGFLADEGFQTTLFSFEVASVGADLLIPLIRIENEVGDVFLELEDYEVSTAGGLIDLVALTGGPVTGRVINICIMLSALGESAGDVGFDDLTFGQIPGAAAEVPLPGALVFMATGLGLAAMRRR